MEVEEPNPVTNELETVNLFERYWTNLDATNVEENRRLAGRRSLWEHEWSRHGSCVSALKRNVSTCHGYFETAIKLAEVLDLRLRVQLKNLVQGPLQHPLPKIQFSHAVNSLKNAHHNNNNRSFRTYKAVVNWQQVEDQVTRDQEYWIASINFCFDLHFNPIDCEISYQGQPRDPNNIHR